MPSTIATLIFLLTLFFANSTSGLISSRNTATPSHSSVHQSQPHTHSLTISNEITDRMDDLNCKSASTPSMPLFSASSKYHHDRKGLSRRRRWLVVDFDGTCTEHDTTPLLPRLAAFATRSRSTISSSAARTVVGADSKCIEDESAGNVEYDHKQDLERRLSQFNELETEFLKRYSDAKSNLFQNDNPATKETQSKKERVQSMHDALEALDEPSNVVTRMVSESRVLHGLGHADSSELEGILQLHGVSTITTASAEEDGINGQDSIELENKVVIRLRNGCVTTLARILSQSQPDHGIDTKCLGWSLAVLSINWCPSLIDASLVQPVLRKKRSILGETVCETEVPIWCNHVNGEGTVTLNIPGALAKRDKILELRNCLEDAHDTDTKDGNNIIIYVGDSSTDLAALLEADIGIIIGSSTSTVAMAERSGLLVLPLQQRHEHGFGNVKDDRMERRQTQILWRVDGWHEIDDMLKELDNQWG
eukprot:scaffold1019_cov192-Alexandrium_tamarense.AAC.2